MAYFLTALAVGYIERLLLADSDADPIVRYENGVSIIRLPSITATDGFANTRVRRPCRLARRSGVISCHGSEGHRSMVVHGYVGKKIPLSARRSNEESHARDVLSMI